MANIRICLQFFSFCCLFCLRNLRLGFIEKHSAECSVVVELNSKQVSPRKEFNPSADTLVFPEHTIQFIMVGRDDDLACFVAALKR